METPSQEESSAALVKFMEEALPLLTQISEDQSAIKLYVIVLVWLVGFIFLLYGGFLAYYFIVLQGGS